MRTPILALAAGLLMSTTAYSQQCLKMVFNEYCLGGSLEELIKNKPGGKKMAFSGLQQLAYGPPGPGGDLVSAHGGHIIGVIRILEPDFTTYSITLSKLMELYGEPATTRRLPSYVRDSYTTETAIHAGSGSISHLWEKDGVRVFLLWSKKGLSLSYRDIVAYDAFKASTPNPDGL